ncbi:hypothetical protein FRC00_009039 [Tulasnella sp. 408]|nr:hypothetical protein FRC00_009039 [Tulasnella sp. 408]
MARDTDDDDSRSAGDNGTTESSVAGPASSTSALGLPGLPVSGSGFAGGSLHHHQSQSRRTSANTNGSQAQDPRVLQHHPSHHGSLKNMNSQSSLAGMPTARSNKQRDPGERVISRTTSRQTSGQGVPPSKASATGDPKENGAAATANGTSTAADPTSTSAVPDRTGQPTPKPSPSAQGGAQSKSSKSHPQTTSRAKFRHTPHLPQYEAERVSAAMMHWSKAPVHGTLPTRSMRAHTVTMVDNIAWIFGGCDERGCWRDVWCFDIETFQWSHPEMRGEMPPPCRAHTATLVDRKIYVFGGGEGPTYYNDLYILDTLTHRWYKPNIPTPYPLPRRAHTAVLYRDTIYVFGGGNGHRALNDVWALDVSVGMDKLKWEQVQTHGTKPGARGYHTANLVGNVMIVLGGSDGRECFPDVWVLDLDKLVWREVKPDKTYRRLSHSSTQVGSYLFVMGGHDGNKYSHELLLFNLVTLQFEPRSTQGRPPSSRGYHVTTLADSRLWVFGGFDGHVVYDDVWILDLAAAAYLPQVTSFGIFVE